MDSEALFIIFVFVCGACFGSFLNCLAFRMIRKEDWIKGRSHCPSCGHVLGFFDLIPVLSWLLLKGRCRYCGSRISIRYPLSELFMGIVFVLAYLKTVPDIFLLINRLILFSIFFCLSLIDLESYIIPDVFVVLGILNRIILTIFQGNIQTNLNDLAGAILISFGIYLIVSLMNFFTKQDCIGGGDIKLIFMICLYTGFYRAVLVLFLSSLLGLTTVLMTGKRKIPFGPCICLAAAAVILIGDQMIKLLIYAS